MTRKIRQAFSRVDMESARALIAQARLVRVIQYGLLGIGASLILLREVSAAILCGIFAGMFQLVRPVLPADLIDKAESIVTEESDLLAEYERRGIRIKSKKEST